MKVITLKQPHASLCFARDRCTGLFLKTIETRTHDRFRGLLRQTIAIHAGLSWDPLGDLEAASWLIRAHDYSCLQSARVCPRATAPHGVILGTVKVASVRWLTATASQRALVNCAPTWPRKPLFGLFLSEQTLFDTPVPATGKQGIWTWDEEAAS